MKIQKETAIFQTPSGSHLFGTATPESDYDYKVICLPSFEDLLLNKKLTNRVQKPEGVSASDKMKAGADEYEFIPLQIFLEQFFEGQTYALELAFAVISNLHMTFEHDYAIAADLPIIQEWMGELTTRFLTRDAKKMVGYAIAQSRQYGLKTERYTVMKKIVEQIEAACRIVPMDERPPNHRPQGDNYLSWYRISDLPKLLDKVLNFPFVKECMIENGDGGQSLVKAIEICGKRFPYTATWNTAVKSINVSIMGYGTRVQEHEGQPADWKALSHAIRIVDEILELNNTGKITFPHFNAKFLLDVKQGKININEATEYLTTRFNLIDSSVNTSILPEKTPELEKEFTKFKIDLLKRYYGL